MPGGGSAETGAGAPPREAVAVAMPAENGETPPEDEGAPIGPSETEEMAFLGEQRAAEPAGGTPEPPANGGENGGALPPLEELMQQIPREARDLLDELFRAKFVGVRRVRQKDLKQ